MDPEEIECDNVGWIHLPHHKDQWQVVMNKVRNLLKP
jgi:hypothetical protein